MRFLSSLKEILSESYKFDFGANDSEFFALTETDKSATCKEAKFRKSKENDLLVYKFDDDKNLFPFLNEVPKAKSMCDYLLFYQKSDSKIFVIICNLKSKNTHNNSDQLKSGRVFATFLVNTVKRVYTIPRNTKIIYKKVLFSEKELRKTAKPSRKIEFYSYACQTGVCDLDAIF